MTPYRSNNFPRLSSRIFKLLREGDTTNRYGGDPMRMACAIIAEANRVGMPVNAVLSLMLAEANHGGERVRSLPSHQQHRFVSRQYEKANARFDEPFADATDARMFVLELRNLVFESQWPSNHERRWEVLLAHTAVMLKAGSTRYTAGMRQLATTAGVGYGTALTATRWLVGQGILTVAKPSKGDKAATYRLSSSAGDKVGSLLTPIEEGSSDTRQSSRSYLFHPVFSYGSGLSWRTWSLLPLNGGKSAAELSAATGYALETVTRHLREMRRSGLAVRLDDRSWVAVEEDELLDEIAAERGLEARLHDRKDRFELQQIERRIGRMLKGGQRIHLGELYRGDRGAA